MKRTKPSISTKQLAANNAVKLKRYNEILNRMSLASYMGQQYGGDRDIYTALGYPTTITFQDYLAKYLRQDIAGTIIKRPIERTWKGDVKVIVSDTPESELERAWMKLYKEHKLKQKFIRADKLSSIGQYGVLLLGLSDVTKQEDWQQPVKKGTKLKLNYITPYSENAATIKLYETDKTKKEYGAPKMYQINNTTDDGKQNSLLVHASRIVHITGEQLGSEYFGIPTLELVYNRLMDLEKTVGGSAEMYWRGARPGYTGKADPDFEVPDDIAETFNEQMEEFEHNMRRMFIAEGIDIKALEQQIADPANTVDVQLQMISAATGIPKRILVGSERGELSSSQDQDTWAELIHTRREEYAEIQIIQPIVDKFMEYGILPKVETYAVEWQSLVNENIKDKAEVGKIRAESLSKYLANPTSTMTLPPEMFYKHVLGFDDEQIEEILQFVDEQQRLEEQYAMEDEAALEEELKNMEDQEDDV